MNIQDFYIGKSFDAYEFFGAHKIGDKILFRVYAPNAAKVSLVGEFNDWQVGYIVLHLKKHEYE